jgi:Holliday junction resolvasome RuvABC endonuclease subunit
MKPNILEDLDDFVKVSDSISIGVDFSIISTAMCVKIDNNFKFYWFPKVEPNNAIPKYWEEIKTVATIIPYNGKKSKHNYTTNSIKDVNNAHLLSELILDCLLDIDKNIPINIEGFSFASTGASFIDLIAYQSIFRSEIVRDGRIFNVYSPTTIKKTFSGSGKSTKDEMCKVFTHENAECQNVQNLQKLVENCVKDRSNIKKPLDDLVDSYAIADMDRIDKKAVERIQRDKTKIEMLKFQKNIEKDVDSFLGNL